MGSDKRRGGRGGGGRHWVTRKGGWGEGREQRSDAQ
jgi:hypothetical protein